MGVVEKVYTDYEPFKKTTLISGYKIKEIEEEMARSWSLPLPHQVVTDESVR